MKKLLIAAAAMSMLFACGAPAYAQTACGPTEEVYKTLANEFKEQALVQGVASGGQLVEVFISPTNGTWTILVTHLEQGVSCLIAAGEQLKLLKPIKGASAA